MTQEDYLQIESSQRQHNELMFAETKRYNEYERHVCDIVKTLGLQPYRDGSEWCVLWGKDMQQGICAFGDTPLLAMMNFYEFMTKGGNQE